MHSPKAKSAGSNDHPTISTVEVGLGFSTNTARIIVDDVQK